MTTEQAINTLEIAIAEVEWDYPIHYSIALQMAIDALRAQQETEKNDPLTLDELRELHGKSVWCKEHNVYGIVDSGGITISFKYDIAYPGLTLYREKPEEGKQWEP